MNIFMLLVSIIMVLLAVILVAVIMLQSGKTSGLSGAITGGSDNYMGKGKSNTLDAKLASWTKWIALAWILFALALTLI